MALGTYSDLVSSVGTWLHRSDLAPMIPDFIRLAETRLNTELDTRDMEVRLVLTATAGTSLLGLPADMVEMRRLIVKTTPMVVLRYATPDQIDKDYPMGQSGVPVSFTVVGGGLELYPVPDSAYALELVYQQALPALTAASPTNWLMTKYPNAYLYGTLLAAHPYIQDDARAVVFERLYSDAVKNINSVDWYSGSTMTVRAG